MWELWAGNFHIDRYHCISVMEIQVEKYLAWNSKLIQLTQLKKMEYHVNPHTHTHKDKVKPQCMPWSSKTSFTIRQPTCIFEKPKVFSCNRLTANIICRGKKNAHVGVLLHSIRAVESWPHTADESNPVHLSQLKSLVILENALAISKTRLTWPRKKIYRLSCRAARANEATNYTQLKRLKWNEAQIYGRKCAEFIARIIGN